MATWAYSYLTWRRIARLITFTPWLRLRQGIVPGQSAAPLPPVTPSSGLAAPGQPVPAHAAGPRSITTSG
jgi:hypothetical protein